MNTRTANEMQHKRHTADYDPDAQFTKSDVVKNIDRVRDVIEPFGAVAAPHHGALPSTSC